MMTSGLFLLLLQGFRWTGTLLIFKPRQGTRLCARGICLGSVLLAAGQESWLWAPGLPGTARVD